MTEREQKAEEAIRGRDYPRYFTDGVGRGGHQVRGPGFPGDQMGVPSDEIGDRPFRLPSRSETRAIVALRKEQTLKAEVYFPQGTVIYPINHINNRPRGGRTLQEVLYANRVYDKKDKPKKVKDLSLWQAVNGVGIWNGKLGKGFIIRPGDKFTAYVKNAKIQK